MRRYATIDGTITAMQRTLSWLAALLLAVAAPALAHPAPFSYLDVRIESAAVDASLVVHVLDVAYDLGVGEAALLDPATLRQHAGAVVALLRGRLQIAVDGHPLTDGNWSAPEPLPDRQALRLTVRYPTARPPGLLTIAAQMFPYDPAHQTFINLYERQSLMLQAILGRDRREVEYFAGTRQGTLAVVKRFVASGVHHILIGPDHLLFLIGLLLLGGSLRQLVLVVSAFTVAHSVTLTLAVLNILAPPAWIIEPAIALSIIYVGADNLTVRGGRDMRAWIAFAFGLIHGFGFANVLREMELPPRALGWSLFSFNLGVEAGQLVVVLAVASALAAVRARSEAAGRRLAVAGSIAVIVAGAFWFIERVFWV
jgi:hydrogenase/urease accessory protein HupE